MRQMKSEISTGLKWTFILVTIEGLFFGLISMLAPAWVASLSGLPGKDLPVYQQAGANAFGYAVIVFLCSRARNWAEVRISTIAVFILEILTTMGAGYYVVLLGVATSYLILILVFSILFAVAFGYYLWQYEMRRK